MSNHRTTAAKIQAGDLVRIGNDTPVKAEAVTLIPSAVLIQWRYAAEAERLDRGTPVTIIRH